MPAAHHSRASLSPVRRSRAGSKEQAGGAAAPVDPILARYHAIKKSMAASSVAPTSAPSSAAPSLSSSSLHLTAPSSRNVTPLRAGGVAATAPVTPELRRAVLHAGSVPMPSTQRDERLESLERSLADKARVISRLEKENRAVTDVAVGNAQASEEAERASRQARYERERLRTACVSLESQVAVESSVAQQSQRRVEELLGELTAVHERLTAAEHEVSTKRVEAARWQQHAVALEKRLQTSDAQAEPLRILEGKVAALDDLVAQRTREAEDARLKQDLALRQVEESRLVIAKLQQAVTTRDREVGEASVAIQNGQAQTQQLSAVVAERDRREMTLVQKCADLEEALRTVQDRSDRRDIDHKEELRQRVKEIAARDYDLCMLTDRLKESESFGKRAMNEVEQLRTENFNATKLSKDLQMRLEATRVTSAQESIVNDELKGECDRLRQFIEELRAEIRAQADAQALAERELEQLDAERRIKNALEGQLKVLQASFARQEDDHNALRARFEDLTKRALEAEERAAAVPKLYNRIAELDATIGGKDVTIEKLRESEALCRHEVSVTLQKLDVERNNVSMARSDFVQEHDRCMELEADSRRLEQECRSLNALHGDIAALQEIVDEKTALLQRAQIETRSWQTRCREAEGELEVLLALREEYAVSEQEKRGLQVQLTDRESQLHGFEKKQVALVGHLRNMEDELRAAKEFHTSLEADLMRQRAALAEKAQAEQRAAQLQGELQNRNDDLNRERSRVHELTARSREREDALADERVRRAEAERQLNEQAAELSRLQLEVGKLSVIAESGERERTRLERELDQRSGQNEAKSAQLFDLQRQLAERERHANEAAAKDRQHVVELDQCHLAIRERDEKLSNSRLMLEDAQKQMRQTQHESKQLLERISQLLGFEERCVSLEGTVRVRDAELCEASRTLTELKDRAREMQQELVAYRRFEQRYADLKAHCDKQAMLAESYENDDAHKTQLLLEKERELGRMRERLASLVSEHDAERLRRTAVETRLKDMEPEANKASQLEGQIAGLTQVIAQRNRDLEDERNSNTDLRNRLRQVERSSAQRGQQANATYLHDLEVKIAMKDEVIARLESEERRRQGVLDQLRAELTRTEAERRSLDVSVRESRSEMDRNDATWLQKFTRLEAEYNSLKAASQHDTRLVHKENELAEARSTLQQSMSECAAKSREIEQCRREIAHLTEQLNAAPPAPSSRSGSVSDRLKSELKNTQTDLHEARSLRSAAERLLEEKEIELAVARENVTLLSHRVTGGGRPSYSSASSVALAAGGGGQSVNAVTSNGAAVAATTSVADASNGAIDEPSATAADPLRDWRERRRELAQLDGERAREYDSIMRGSAAQAAAAARAAARLTPTDPATFTTTTM